MKQRQAAQRAHAGGKHNYRKRKIIILMLQKSDLVQMLGVLECLLLRRNKKGAFSFIKSCVT